MGCLDSVSFVEVEDTDAMWRLMGSWTCYAWCLWMDRHGEPV